MSLATESFRIQYTGDGLETSFSFPYPVQEDSDLVVDVDGTTKTLTTHYVVAIAGGGGSATVDFNTAPAADAVVTIYRRPAFTQEVDYVANDAFPAESHEDALDKLTMETQYLLGEIQRALRIPLTDSTLAAMTEAARAGKLLGFDANGDFAYYTAGDLGAASNYGYVLFANQTARDAAIPAFKGQVGIQVDTLQLYLGDPTVGGGAGDLDAGDWKAYPDFNATQTFADETARGNATPVFEGQLGTQLDTGIVYRATGVSAGNWVADIYLRGSEILAENMTDFKAAIAAANSSGDDTRIVCNGAFALDEHLSQISSTGTDYSIRRNITLAPTPGTTFDCGRNVLGPIRETAITSSTGVAGGDMIFTLAGHGLSNGNCICFRSNGPLPIISGTTRLTRDSPYFVVSATTDTFKISTTSGGAAVSTGSADGAHNLVDIWIFRAFAANQVTNNAGILEFSITGHGVAENQRVWIWKNASGTLPTNISGGVSQDPADNAKFYAINVSANTFQLTEVIAASGSRVAYAATGAGNGHIFITSWDFQIDGTFEGGGEQRFVNFVTGSEYRATGDGTSGLPSVWGTFGGAERNAIWWTGKPETLIRNYCSNALGLTLAGGSTIGSGNVRFVDRTEGVQAAVASRGRVLGSATSGGGFTSTVTFYESSYGNTRVYFPGGVYRCTDKILFHRPRNIVARGEGFWNTHFIGDLWKDNPGNSDYGYSANDPDYSFLDFADEPIYGAGLVDLSVQGTTRTPADSALIHLSNGGGAENTIFRNIWVAFYKKFAFYLGNFGCNHPRFEDIYIQFCLHPHSTAYGLNGTGGIQKVTISGGTWNSGTHMEMFYGVQSKANAEASIDRVHLENSKIGFQSESTVKFDLEQIDGVSSSRYYLFEPLGGNAANMWPLAGTSAVAPNRKLTLSAPSLGASTITFTTAAAHGWVEGDWIAVFGADGLTDGGSPIDGMYQAAAGTTGSTLVIDITTPGGALGGGAEPRAIRLRANGNHLGDSLPVVFHSACLGSLAAPTGLDMDRFYWTTNHSMVAVTPFDIDLSTDTISSAAHPFADGDVVMVVPCYDGTDLENDYFLPVGLSATIPYYIVNSGANDFQLSESSGGAAVDISEYSMVDGNQTLGDEGGFYIMGLKVQLAASVDDALDGTAVTFAGTEVVQCTNAKVIVQTRNTTAYKNNFRNLTMSRALYSGSSETARAPAPIAILGSTLNGTTNDFLPSTELTFSGADSYLNGSDNGTYSFFFAT